MTLSAILLALSLVGAPKETATPVAEAVARYARTPQEAAFLVAWGRYESEYSPRIIANDCRKYECDHGRARGAWQAHRVAAGKLWDDLPGNIDAQARVAARHARWALGECSGDARCAFRLLGGLHRDRKLKGEEKRVETYARALEALR